MAWPGALPPCARARREPRATCGPQAVRPGSGPGRSSAPAPRCTCALVNRSEPQTPRRHPELSPGSASPTKMSTASRPTLRPAGSLLTRIVRTQCSFTKELALPAPDSKCGSLHKTRVVQPPWLSHCAGAVGGQGHGTQAQPWRAGARRSRGPAATLSAHGGRGPGSGRPRPAEAAGREETRAARSAARVPDGLAAGNQPPRVPRRRARWFRLVLSALESGRSGASFPRGERRPQPRARAFCWSGHAFWVEPRAEPIPVD